MTEAEIVQRHMPFVKLSAYTFCRRYAWDYDDAVQAGSIGLLRAIRAYDPSRGVPFGAYMRPRIKGEIYDEYRKFFPEVRRKYRDNGPGVILSIDAPEFIEQPVAPPRVSQHDITAALARLNPRAAAMIRLRIMDGVFGKEVGRRYGVTEGRVGQIITQGLKQIRHSLVYGE